MYVWIYQTYSCIIFWTITLLIWVSNSIFHYNARFIYTWWLPGIPLYKAFKHFFHLTICVSKYLHGAHGVCVIFISWQVINVAHTRCISNANSHSYIHILYICIHMYVHINIVWICIYQYVLSTVYSSEYLHYLSHIKCWLLQ